MITGFVAGTARAMRRSRLSYLRIAALVLVPLSPGRLSGQTAPTPTVPEALSLEQAISIAREHNPGFRGQQNDIRVSQASVRSAYGEFLPTASASSSVGYIAPGERRAGSVVLAEQPSVYSSSYNLGMSYSVSAAKVLQPSISRSEVSATRARVAGAEANLVKDVTQRYLSVLQAHEGVAQAERELRRAGEHLRLARARVEFGAASPLDVKRAEVQQAQVEVRVLRAKNGVRTEMQALARLLGLTLGSETRLVSEFKLAEPRLEVEALVQRAIENSPAAEVVRASAQTARLRVSSARAAYLPTMNLNVSFNGWIQRSGDIDALVRQRLAGRAYDEATETRVRGEVEAQNSGFPFGYNRQPMSASLGVSVPVFQGFSRQTQVAQARASVEDAEYQLRAEHLRLRAEVTTAVLNLETAYRVALLQEKVRERASEELRLAEDRFRAGSVHALVVTDAQTQLAQAEQEQIDALYDFHKSLATLEALVGETLR